MIRTVQFKFISGNDVQINYRAVVTKYFGPLFGSSIETKSFKPRKTADNNSAYKIYLLKCMGHENELPNLTNI